MSVSLNQWVLNCTMQLSYFSAWNKNIAIWIKLISMHAIIFFKNIIKNITWWLGQIMAKIGLPLGSLGFTNVIFAKYRHHLSSRRGECSKVRSSISPTKLAAKISRSQLSSISVPSFLRSFLWRSFLSSSPLQFPRRRYRKWSYWKLRFLRYHRDPRGRNLSFSFFYYLVLPQINSTHHQNASFSKKKSYISKGFFT